ncbi:MAG TPA: pentapeptide repeat-containing protein [Planctomycetota bacterium]|nr:pentapeptide repeat-containing protein [Planctomycetota bacterium]HRU52615.1 pentapeptide repeat-containing protein [Planctomycetota bacterium]
MAKEYKSMTIEEVKQELQDGKIIQDAYIDRWTMCRMDVPYKIVLDNCRIDHLDFNSSNFLEEVDIRRCKIKNFILSDATFQKKVNLKQTIVTKGRIQRAIFQDDFYWTNGQIYFTSFFQTTFQKKTDFSRSKFIGDATFNECIFQGDATFNYAIFGENFCCKKTKWHGKADLRNISVNKDVEFQEAHFHDELLLNSATIQLGIDFYQTQLDGLTIFNNAGIQRTLNLLGVQVSKKQGFQFGNCVAKRIILDKDTVDGHIHPEQYKQYGKAAKEYAFLRTVFQNNNNFEEEDWAYYQFKRMERKSKKDHCLPHRMLKRLVEYFFLDLGCGYGTKPFRTLGVCFLIILAFATLYFTCYTHNMQIDRNYGFTNPTLVQITYAFDLSLTAFSGGYSDIMEKGSIRLFAMMEYLLGIVFMGLFIVAFSRKVIR